MSPLYRLKVDATHKEIRDTARGLGLVWCDTFRAGFGAPDGLVLIPPFGWFTLEIKTDDGELTEAEQKLFDEVQAAWGENSPHWIVISAEEFVGKVNRLREKNV